MYPFWPSIAQVLRALSVVTFVLLTYCHPEPLPISTVGGGGAEKLSIETNPSSVLERKRPWRSSPALSGAVCCFAVLWSGGRLGLGLGGLGEGGFDVGGFDGGGDQSMNLCHPRPLPTLMVSASRRMRTSFVSFVDEALPSVVYGVCLCVELDFLSVIKCDDKLEGAK